MVDKSVSIKSATDQQLDELLRRLRKEREVQNLIAEIKRTAEGQLYDYNTYTLPQISTEKPIDSLYHYGVLGMRWGVRRARPRTSSSKDYRQSRKLMKKGIKKLSTQDLRELNQRLQLEKQYKDLNPSTVQRGMRFLTGVVTMGTTVTSLYTLLKSPLAMSIAKVIKKAIKK
jgi:hypothetical protein